MHIIDFGYRHGILVVFWNVTGRNSCKCDIDWVVFFRQWYEVRAAEVISNQLWNLFMGSLLELMCQRVL